jgi:WD40 repeat protein
MLYQIFISLRFAEAGPEAEALKQALEARGISTFLCAVHPGGDIAREIVNALHGCQLAIIMGTRTYGKDTGVGYSTFEELRFIKDDRKLFFLVKMCERFEEPETRFRLDSSVSYFQWFPGRPLPEDLVPKILEKLSSIGRIPSSRPIVKDNTGCISTETIGSITSSMELNRPVNSKLPSLSQKPPSSTKQPGYLARLSSIFTATEMLEDEKRIAKQKLEEEKRIAVPPITLPGHSGVFSVIQLSDGRLASGSGLDVKIWNVNSGACERTLSVNSCIDSVTQLSDGRLASGSSFGVQIWNVNSGACERTLSGNYGVHSVIQLSDGRLALGCFYGVKIWNGKSRTCERTLSYLYAVYSVIQLSDGRLASGSNEKTVKIWNLTNWFRACEKTLLGHSGVVYSVIQLSDGRLASGSGDTTVKIWNVNSGACERTLSGHSGVVCSVIQLSDDRLASGSWDQTVKIWNVDSGACERTLAGHSSFVYSVMQLWDGRLASGSGDGTLKIWNV